MFPDTKIVVDARRLNAALAVAERYSKSSREKILASTAYHVVKRTEELTPFASPAKIATELGTAVALIPRKRGGGFIRRKRDQRYVSGRMINVTTRWGKPTKPQDVPLAALIVNLQVVRPDTAQPTPASKNFQRRTNYRWARHSSPFRGLTRAAGAAAMRAAVHRLTASRFSSSKYLIAGWSAVRHFLRPYLYSGVPAVDTVAGVNEDLGRIAIFRNGNQTTLEIANRIGMMPGRKGDNSAAQNRALHRYSGPALQRAVDEEAASKMAIYKERMDKEELIPAWNAA